ncbi:MAG: ATP-binding protein [Leeuwenhoekiella sp.]
MKTPDDLTSLMEYLREALLWRLKNPDDVLSGFKDTGHSSLKKQFTENSEIDILEKEHLLLKALALSPYILPQLLNETVASVYPNGGDLPEFGGLKGKNHRGILPTGETALFLLAGNSIAERFRLMPLFSAEAKLFKSEILLLKDPPLSEPKMSGRLLPHPDFLDRLFHGKEQEPQLSTHFPAQHLKTKLTWDDLILKDETLEAIKDIEVWLRNQSQLKEKHDKRFKFKPGFRVLFYGPPGTGKTLTATLLGKYTKKQVYRIDLSVVVSKYIGETEKHLSNLFDKARNKNWILFFDEADALFGRRTKVRDAHDKYANQEVSYLLQRIEEHPGLVILATNLKSNMDVAFTRRFQVMVHFPAPGVEERLKLWSTSLPEGIDFSKEINLKHIAERYEVTGAHINNIVHYCCLQSLENKTTTLSEGNLISGIKREYQKENKMF